MLLVKFVKVIKKFDPKVVGVVVVVVVVAAAVVVVAIIVGVGVKEWQERYFFKLRLNS